MAPALLLLIHWVGSMSPTLGEPVGPGASAADVAPVGEAASAGVERVKPKLITPAIVAAAQAYLEEQFTAPLGSEQETWVADRHYVFVLEPHYHPPGYVGGPSGWHKGVTVYEVR